MCIYMYWAEESVLLVSCCYAFQRLKNACESGTLGMGNGVLEVSSVQG